MKTNDENELKELSQIHPGEILQEEFLTLLKISQYRLAKAIQREVRPLG